MARREKVELVPFIVTQSDIICKNATHKLTFVTAHILTLQDELM
jgi:hypothetical protein